MRDPQRLGALVVVVLACVACARARVETRLAVRQFETPAAAGSGEPNLAVAPDGRVLLSWIEPAGENQHSLRYAARPKGGAWSKPETIASGSSWFVNWADFPSLATLPDGTLFAHWLAKSGPGTYAYDVQADGFSLDDKRNPVEANDLPDVASRWLSLSKPDAPEKDRARTDQSFLVPKDDIVAQGYDLSLNRYKEIVHDEIEHRAPLEIIADIETLEDEIAKGLAELKAMLS